MSSNKKLLQRALFLTGHSILITAISACGGGGGGGGGEGSSSTDGGTVVSPPRTLPDIVIISPSDPISLTSYNKHLFLTNAATAREAGYSGKGMIIGVVDSGIDTSNPALQGLVSKSFSYVDSRTNNLGVEDVRGHGTDIAQTIAGLRIDPFSGGVAPGTTLVSARIIPDSSDSAGSSGYSLAKVNADVANTGAKIINNSWSIPDWVSSDTSKTQYYVNAYKDFVVNRGGLVVFSSGNEAGKNPYNIAALPTIAGSAELEKGWLVVSAINPYMPDTLANYANACGQSMDYCLVAPGTVSVLMQDKDGSVYNKMVSGTSVAAPQVSGAAGLVWNAFPYFSNDLIRQTLLGTATDMGAAGVDAVFGHGLLNVEDAVKGPAKFDWGNVTVAFDGYSSTWGNAISGEGGLNKEGTGTLVLTEDATYTGKTTVLGGTLVSNKSLVSAVEIGSAGTLDIRRVGGNVYNQGSVVLRDGQTQFNSNYTQTAQGQLAFMLGSTLDVKGSATIAGNLHVLGIPQGYITKAQQEVLNAQGGLTGTFDSFTKASGVFLDATLGYSSQKAWLNIERINATNVGGVTYTAATVSGANRLEKAFTALDQPQSASVSTSSAFVDAAASVQQAATPQRAQVSMESLSGQLPAANRAMMMQAVNVNNRQFSDHVSRLMDSPMSNSWANNVSYQGSLSSSGFSGVSYNMNGWVTGQDVFLNKNTFFGSSVTSSTTSGSLHRGSEENHGTVGEASFYGGKLFDSYYMTARVASGFYDGQQKRRLLLGNQSATVTSDQRGSYYAVGGEMGYRMKKEGWQVVPYVDTQYISLKQSAFKEEGGSGFGLKADAQTTTRFQAGVGTRAGYTWDMGSKGTLNLSGQVHYQRAISEDRGRYYASFTGVDQYMPLDGVASSRDTLMAAGGIGWQFMDTASLNLAYEQYFGNRQNSNNVSLGLAVSF